MSHHFTLVIGNKNYSSWSFRPWLIMKYFDIPFKEVLIPLYVGEFKKEILKYSSSGKVPILIDDKITLWDSLSIAEYLAEAFPQKNLWPKDIAARAHARNISAEMHSGFTALRSLCPMDVKATREPKDDTKDLQNDITRIKSIWLDCRQKYQKEGDFLFGKFSIADAMYAPVVFRFKTYGLKTEGLVQQYYETMLSVPAVKEWQAAALKETWVIHG